MKKLFVIIILLVSANILFAQQSKESKREKSRTRKAATTYSCPMHPEVVSYNSAFCAKCKSQLVVDRVGSKQGKTTYTCSMHPNFVSNEEGSCPVCGMEMTAVKAKAKTKKG